MQFKANYQHLEISKFLGNLVMSERMNVGKNGTRMHLAEENETFLPTGLLYSHCAAGTDARATGSRTTSLRLRPQKGAWAAGHKRGQPGIPPGPRRSTTALPVPPSGSTSGSQGASFSHSGGIYFPDINLAQNQCPIFEFSNLSDPSI